MERTTHHTIFYLQELLSIIFRFCTSADYTGKEVLDKGTLASLARTCWSFHAAALDVLYSHTDMGCLVRTMSRDLWARDTVTLYFQRPMDLQDWSHLLHYSRRVRILYTYCGNIIDEGIYLALSHPPDSFSNMFPKLIGLRVENIVHREFISLLITRNLTSISLAFDEGDETATHILPTLPLASPFLRCVKFSRAVHHMIMNTVNATSAHEVLCKLPLLETLLCSSEVVMSAKILSYIACLPALKEVDITLPVYPLQKFASSRNIFPVLQKLKLSSSTPQSCLQLLESVTSTSVEAVQLRASSIFSDEVSQKIVAVLSSFKNLTHITILEHPLGGPPEDYGYYSDALDPLLRLRNLQHLQMCAGSTYSVDDEVLSQIASAWPRIKYLDLWPPEGWGGLYRATLSGIIPLLHSCPNLHFLGMEFDATLPLREDLSTYDTRNSKIPLDLDVGISPILDPPLIAAFLSHVATNLRSLAVNDMFCRGAIYETYEARWKEVGQIVGAETQGSRIIALSLDRSNGSLSSLD
ncbi:hypothetical protein BJ138DRAFT_1157259 [Hygrophoropsis aurantiaca]|uniref:Uncharacterized protein n=1 Tax=Hygrophoropsis aurantiaca TaxID=72124 RepID=A0ACB8A540_9AGAM|nr:hypothetical protein BJ138DRAFT_1157259 [Hygrophoropsis aurantiaca]